MWVGGQQLQKSLCLKKFDAVAEKVLANVVGLSEKITRQKLLSLIWNWILEFEDEDIEKPWERGDLQIEVLDDGESLDEKIAGFYADLPAHLTEKFPDLTDEINASIGRFDSVPDYLVPLGGQFFSEPRRTIESKRAKNFEMRVADVVDVEEAGSGG